MGDKINDMNSQKHVFWQALLFAAIIFVIGIFLGFMLENSRTNKIANLYANSDLDLFDVKIQSEIISSFESVECASAVQNNLDFADRIFQESKILDRFEEQSKISDSIKIQHKKYDLMRTLLWVNSIKLKEKCNSSYHNVVYLYDYNNPRLDVKAKQSVFSRLLGDVKADMGDSVLLIPIAADNSVSSLSFLMSLYNVREDELPVVLIDEKIKISKVDTKAEIEKYL